ncbi:hypothetical protein [Blastococcus sp. VKM Ac-2987]|uniref:hypothetical protein n=1 Tax=Blastococcus sp. VKM Ac-2987 TaxID=3004141 RepID=UPI0022ABAE8A|nr:hypothetical protein [Blastococcus sp. VKM Ac-2987]MCZ2857278.1 hypothetical protein [Blastococcus sp. VKM Ac-2987]
MPGAALEVHDPATGALVLSVVVTDVVAGASCTDPSVTAGNGSLVAVRLTVTTGADLALLGGERSVVAGDLHLVGDDGTVATGAGPAGVCDIGAAPLPDGPLAPSQELTGTVVLDVQAVSGAIVYRPGWVPADGG